MRHYRIGTTESQYGCFTLVVRCTHCKHPLFKKPLSYDKHKVGPKDFEKLQELSETELSTNCINFCCNCGHTIIEEAEV